jgi:hypothetical protein
MQIKNSTFMIGTHCAFVANNVLKSFPLPFQQSFWEAILLLCHFGTNNFRLPAHVCDATAHSIGTRHCHF